MEENLSVKIMRGKPVAEQFRLRVAPKIQGATIALLLVGDDGPSEAYSRQLTKLVLSLGGQVNLYTFPANIAETEVLKTIEELNVDEEIKGIMPLFPMPPHISEELIGDAITPAKDLDCQNSYNIGEFYARGNSLAPATAKACLAILKFYGIELDGKRAVVIGRSNVVGKPVANLLLQENCTVTICHSHTQNLAAVTKEADIVVAALGKPNFLQPEMVKEGVVLVDVGINVTEKGIVGDIAPACYAKSFAYTPVPGGVGVMANIMLLGNIGEF